MNCKYHYEFSCYTDNLNYGRLLIGTYKTHSEAEYAGHTANKGCFRVEKTRVYD